MPYFKYLKILICFLPVITGCLFVSASGKANSATEKIKASHPDIVLINMDDMGYGDVEVNGGIGYTTPNIDALAKQGMRFTNFEDVQPVCRTSRAGLMTGTYPNRMGIFGYSYATSNVGFSKKDETIAGMLKKVGYATGIIGKWHLGDAKRFLPLQQGFEYYFGLPYSNDMWPHKYYPPSMPIIDPSNIHFTTPPLPLLEGKRIDGKPAHYRVVRYIRNMRDQAMLTTWYTQKAVSFIKRHRKQPFFLYLAHSMPHVPIAVSDKFKGKSKQGLYGDVMEEIDWSVSRVMRTIKDNGLQNNTLLILTSDNGPWLTFGNHAGSAGGLREGKQTTFEGGNRAVAIMRWPNVIPAGTISNKLVSNLDVLPTLAAITRAPLPASKIDGINVLPLLKGEKNANPRDYLLYYYHNPYHRSEKNDLEAVRQGHWKLVLPHPYTSNVGGAPGQGGRPGRTHKALIDLSLYNLRRDPGERYNVVKEHPKVVKNMMKLVGQARKDLGDDLTNTQEKNGRPLGKCSHCQWPGLPASWTESRSAKKFITSVPVQISQKRLKQFAAIYGDLNKRYEKYKSKLERIKNKVREKKFRQKARKAMHATIQKHGMTLLEYRQIQVAINKSPKLRQEFRKLKPNLPVPKA
jgi:arylsulfatase